MLPYFKELFAMKTLRFGDDRNTGGDVSLKSYAVRRTVTNLTVDKNGVAAFKTAKHTETKRCEPQQRAKSKALARFVLTCDGPTLISDLVRQQIGNQMVPLVMHTGRDKPQPLRFQWAVRQSLRARAAFIEARWNPKCPNTPTAPLPVPTARRHQEISGLTSIRHLFGVTGWGGLVSVHQIDLKLRDCKKIHTSAVSDLEQANLARPRVPQLSLSAWNSRWRSKLT